MQTVICDPPYYSRVILELSSSEHDLLSLQDMSRFVELHLAVMG